MARNPARNRCLTRAPTPTDQGDPPRANIETTRTDSGMVMMAMRDGDWFWVGVAAASVGFEAWAIKTNRHHMTLSRSVRRGLFLHTRTGRSAIISLGGSGAVWLVVHLLDLDEASLDLASAHLNSQKRNHQCPTTS